MKGINKVILVCTVTQDVEVKYAANGNAIANLNVVTNEEWKDKNTGQKQEKAEFHRVSIFGKLAEIAGQYVTKGTHLYLEGKLSTRKWQDQNGQDRYTTEVVLSGFDGVMQMLGGGDKSQVTGQPAQQAQPLQGQQMQAPVNNRSPHQQNSQGQAPQPQRAPAYAPNDFDDDDVPF